MYIQYVIYGYCEREHRQSKTGTLRVICQSLPTTTTTMSIIMQFGIVSFGISILPRQLRVAVVMLCQNLANIMSKVFPNKSKQYKMYKMKNYNDNLLGFCLFSSQKNCKSSERAKAKVFGRQTQKEQRDIKKKA